MEEMKMNETSSRRSFERDSDTKNHIIGAVLCCHLISVLNRAGRRYISVQMSRHDYL